MFLKALPMRTMALKAVAIAGLMSLMTPAFAANEPELDLVAPIAEYKIYVSEKVDKLVEDTEKFTAAIKAGKVDEAKALFAPTRISYEAIEPIAELFADLDKSIDARADDFEKEEKDPNFTGFHRIEYSLWETKSTDDIQGTADKLLTDVKDLQARISDLAFPPETVVGGAAALMEEVAATKISGEEDRYSHTDLWDFRGNFDGSRKIFDLFKGFLGKDDAAFVTKVTENFDTVDEILSKYKEGEGYVSYEKLTDDDRNTLSAAVNTLAEDLSELRGKLGLE
ncbi:MULTISPECIES: iron uptake system protein EfeO [unclassified Bartonella]|uniref:iron uptake system protein EfeO n=1 Tax=unclassified Bartonella TaxID=2645622 RepID=UPI003965A7B2